MKSLGNLFLGLLLLGLLLPQAVSAEAVLNGNVSPQEVVKEKSLLELGRIYLLQFDYIEGILSALIMPADNLPVKDGSSVNLSNVAELALFIVNETNVSAGNDNDINVVAENISTTILDTKFSFQESAVVENETVVGVPEQAEDVAEVPDPVETKDVLPEEAVVETATLEEKVFDATQAEPVATKQADPVEENSSATEEANVTLVVQAKGPETIKTPEAQESATDKVDANLAVLAAEAKVTPFVQEQNVTAEPELELPPYHEQEEVAAPVTSEVNYATNANGQRIAMLGSVGQNPSTKKSALVGREAQGYPKREPLKLGMINNGGQVPDEVVNRANTLAASVGSAF